MMKRIVPLLLSFGLTGAACAQEAVFLTKTLTPETALEAAQVALESCRKQGYQVAVAVTDRGYVMESGLITLDGPAEQLLHDPAVRAAYLGE